MRHLTIIVVGILALGFFSCGRNSATPGDHAEDSSTDTTLVLKGLSKEFTMRLPRMLTSRFTVENSFNENFGHVEVRVGEAFVLFLSEEKVSTMALKEELTNDQLFSYNFETENDTELVYQSILPDGNPHSFQFVKSRNFGKTRILARTDQSSQFNRSQLKIMEEAVASLEIKE